MTQIIDRLLRLQELFSVNGYETIYSKKKIDSIAPFLSDWQMDAFGNLYYEIHSDLNDAPTILIEAHRDVIGLCVKEIHSGGFISISSCGGIDPVLLPGEEFFILASKSASYERIKAVAASLPPHLKKTKQKDRSLQICDIILDVGSENANKIQIGDPVCFSKAPCQLLNSSICSHGLDNLAGVLSVIQLKEKISKKRYNIVFLLSSGEEALSNGVNFFLKNRRIDAALVIDAGFAYQNGMNHTKCILRGGGVALSLTDTLSHELESLILTFSREMQLSLQVVVEAGGTGSSASAIQVQSGGIPTALLSIPLSNMHSASEIVDINDIKSCIIFIEMLLQSDVFSKLKECYYD